MYGRYVHHLHALTILLVAYSTLTAVMQQQPDLLQSGLLAKHAIVRILVGTVSYLDELSGSQRCDLAFMQQQPHLLHSGLLA